MDCSMLKVYILKSAILFLIDIALMVFCLLYMQCHVCIVLCLPLTADRHRTGGISGEV